MGMKITELAYKNKLAYLFSRQQTPTSTSQAENL